MYNMIYLALASNTWHPDHHQTVRRIKETNITTKWYTTKSLLQKSTKPNHHSLISRQLAILWSQRTGIKPNHHFRRMIQNSIVILLYRDNCHPIVIKKWYIRWHKMQISISSYIVVTHKMSNHTHQ